MQVGNPDTCFGYADKMLERVLGKGGANLAVL
jgi:hypothetical protein